MHELRDWTIPAGTFDALYGLELTEVSDGRLRARRAGPGTTIQASPFGLVHGGVLGVDLGGARLARHGAWP